MYEGRAIQDRDINAIGSARRNPIIADLFHRMRYMERRGSGLKKILDSTSKLPGYTDEYKPVFYSTDTDFVVVLKNVNYTTQETTQDKTTILLNYCITAKTREEMQSFLRISNREYFRKSILTPLLEAGLLKMTMPDKPTSRNQKYIKA